MKTAAVFLTGVSLATLAMFLAHPTQRVKAQGNQLRIHVGEVPRGGEVDMDGSQVVGFSCIPAQGQANAQGQSLQFRCFVDSKE